MVWIFDSKFRRSSSSTSCSFGAIGSRRRSTRESCSASTVEWGRLTAGKNKRSVRSASTTVIRELERDAEVVRLDQSNCFLQIVLALARHAHLVGLNRGLNLDLGVFDGPDDGLGLLDLDALDDLGPLPNRAAGGQFDLPVVQRLEGDAPLDQLGLHDVLDAAQLSLVIRDQH